MMIWMIALAAGGFGLICAIVCFAMVKAASDADRRMEEMMQCIEDNAR